jgi:Plavaka transposase
MTGHTEYYPLYLSIGNIHNSLRRGHRNGVVVVAFLAIPHGQSMIRLFQIVCQLTYTS